MLGTFAGALDARQIDAKHGRLIAEVRGEIEESDDKVLVIRRVHVRFLLKAAEDVRIPACGPVTPGFSGSPKTSARAATWLAVVP